MCTFAIQTVVCGTITGNISDPISITFYATEPPVRTLMGSLHPTENQGTHDLSTVKTMGINNSATSKVYIISFSSLATALVVGAVVLSIVVIAILKRNKAKTTAVFIPSNRAEGTSHDEPVYKNVPVPLPSVSIVNTQDNVAYGCTRTSTRAAGVVHDEPMYEDVTGPLPSVSANTMQENVAYGCT